MAHKIATWLVSEKGRKFTFGVVSFTSIGICGACTFQHTFLLQKYKEIVQLYKSGVPVRLPESVISRFNKAVELLEIPEMQKSLIRPFTVFGFDIFNAGTLYSKFGGIVGIPINFTYGSVENIEKSDIMVNNEPVNWSSSEGEQLLRSLVLSEKAQIFAIAREISTLNSVKLFLDTFFSTSTFILMYGLANNFNRKYNLYTKPFPFRGFMYSIITVFGYGLYAFLTDFTQNHFDTKIDKELCEKNQIFLEGGLEFYDKIVQRNIALRKLMGPYGERKYSAMGNENFFLRHKCVPLVVRKDFFVNKMQNIV